MWAVYYASAGCLPDGDDEAPAFEDIRDAAQYIASEHREVCEGRGSEWVITPEFILDARGADDPTPGSLYRWSIESV